MSVAATVEPAAAAPSPRSGNGVIALAAAVTVITNLPVFLVGALVAEIGATISIPASGLGFATAAFWVFSAASSVVVGSWGHRTSVRALSTICLVLSVLSLLGSVLLLPSWPWMLVWAAIGGIANGLGHPASNGLLAARLPTGRRGTALGVKQASVPLAGLVAGASLPLVALTIGWESAFVVGAVSGAGVLIVLLVQARGAARGRSAAAPAPRISRELRRYLLLLTAVTTLAATAINATAVFAVTAAVQRGFDPAVAGLLLSAASLVAAITRITLGVAADRGRGGTIATVRWVLLVAILGLGIMALPFDWAFCLGLLLAIGVGWGWPGVTHYIVARVSGKAVAAGTGIVQTGSYIGNAVGPALLGVALQFWGPLAPWLVMAAISAAALLMATIAARVQPPEAP